jgi:ureidoglycolate hydrolase
MSSYIDIHSHENEGFKVLVQYQSWRTAVLNQGKENRAESLSYVEKHKETDEVFVLLKGKAHLICGGDNEKPDSFEVLPMDLYKTYNVKANVWHAVVMRGDAYSYIVENIDKIKENSGYYNLKKKKKETIQSRVSK